MQIRPRKQMLLTDTSGASMLEYVVIAAIVVVVGWAAWMALGDQIVSVVERVTGFLGEAG